MASIKIILLPIITLALGLIWSFTDPAPPRLTPAYPEELPGPFTGGFGEESCHSCHFDYSLNPEQGTLKIEGIPDRYQSGKSYKISISLSRDDLGQAGFQLSSRFEDGSQAGSFEKLSDHLNFTEVKSKIQYLQHSQSGSKVQNKSTASWQFTWIAPDSGAGKIIFNVAANSGNGDASAFGDYIYVEEIVSSGTGQQ